MLDTATLDAGDKNLTTDYDTDALGRVVHVTNALDNGTTYAYDARGRLSSVTSDQAVPRLTFEVEESNAMDVNQDGRISTEDLDLVRHIALGDGVFNSTVVSNADINEDGTVDSADTQLVADYYADVRSSGDGWIPKTVISYFMDNTVAAILTYDDPHSSQPLRRVSYYYDILANPTRVYINNERTSILDYDEAGNCVSVLLAEQPADIEELDSEGNPVTITPGVVPASASRASYAYDTRGNLFEEVRGTEPDDVRTAYAYTPGGKIWKVKVGPEGLERTTTFAYDAFSRIASITDAAETVYSSTFDACGNITRKTTTGVADANGAVAVLRDVKCENYDPMNRVKDINVLSRDPLTGVETWSSSSIDYNAASLPTSISLPLENAIGIACDTMYRTKRRSDSEGNKTEFGYDASSNTQTIVQTQVSEVDASVETYTTSYAWDCLNRLILKDENGGERVQLFSHDALDNLVRYEDASCSVAGQLGRATDCAYNGRGQLEELRPDNTQFIGNTYIEPRPITFRYDTSGRRSGVVDGQGNETTFEYNGYDALEKVTAADGTILRNIEYNDFGDVYRITDANETVVTNTFDAVGRITGRTIAAGAGVETVGQEVFEYDGLSRIVSASTGGNVAELRYDTLGALIYDSVNNAPLSALTDVMGNITDLYYPSSGRSVNFQYDSLGRMDLVTDSALGQVAQYFHVGPSRIKKKLLGGIAAGTETSYNYDTNWLPEFIEQRQRPSNALIDYRQFEYEKMANLAKRANLIGVGNESGKTHDYTYDSFYRLQTSSVDGQLQTEYALDLTGNRRTVTTYPGPTAEEYVLDGTLGAAPDFETVRNQYAATPFDEGRQYDAMGNLRVIEHVAGDETFTYDFQNRLITYAASDGIVTRYTYDGFGRRIRKEVGYGGASPTITQYIYFGWQLIEERDGQGLRIANYLYGLGTTPIAIERDTNGDGSFETYLVQTGRLGNVVALTDAAGNIVERYDYDDFGKPVFLSPNWQVIPQSLYDNSILFNGQYYDEESGLYYYRLRYYEPPTGRFITHDPLGIWGDFNNLGNPYAYVGNNPWSFVDPFGLKGEVDPIFFEAEHPIMRFADADNNDPIRVAGQVLSAAAEGSDLAQEIVALSDLLGCVMADSDSRHAALDAAGLVGDSAGGLGFLFDGANAIAYGKEGDLWNAGISLAAMVPVVGDLGKGLRYTDDVADIAKAAKLKELTRDNFRENLIRYTGNSPYPDMHAHHVFPHEFRDKFWSAGIDVNDPRFGAWWDAGAHLNNHKKYNDEWREFLRQNPTRDQVIERGRDLADELGFSVVF
jgi:RHS repeat-associated protein